MFFTPQRESFFRPLVGKYREAFVLCLQSLYERLYAGVSSEYSAQLDRPAILLLFSEKLANSGDIELLDDDEQRFKSFRELAAWVLLQMQDCGWLEKQTDPVSLQSRYQFSRTGRLFVEPFTKGDSLGSRTRHRNARNCRNALHRFIDTGATEVYDLLDALDASERIIADYSEVIEELNLRRRQLVDELEMQVLIKKASDQFFDFMEQRFRPDLSIRLSADSVEKHRDEVQGLIAQVRDLDNERKASIERRLREVVPELVEGQQSVLWTLLDTIEQRFDSAAQVILPALRKALQSFTRRADVIIRQMSYLASQQHQDVVSVCQALRQLPVEQQNRRLRRAAQLLEPVKLGFIDPASVVYRQRRSPTLVPTEVEDLNLVDLDRAAQQELAVAGKLEQAFFIRNDEIKQFALRSLLKGQELSTRQMQIENAPDLLAYANSISLAGLQTEDGWLIDVREDESGADQHHYFHQKDHFLLRLHSPQSEQENK